MWDIDELNTKSWYALLKHRILEVTCMLIGDEIYTKENAADALMRVIYSIEEMEP
ncbi:hypothetical protein ACIFOT_11375 [Neobacillus sp. NRS-1170]|uniref:hypothetical protein n=1 Tax=Neobacillus sp. NRS-1170 TaxID=3233898 RepID=UPI003D2E0D6B